MDLQWTVLLVAIVQWVPSVILVVASVTYARRVRSGVSLSLAVGTAGGLLVAIASMLFPAYGMSLMQTPEGYSQLAGMIMAVLSLAGFAFSLLFAVSLYRILRGLHD